MRKVCDYQSCLGCGQCVITCPVSCITMVVGKLGHLFPIIDEERCINCRLCERNCPALNLVDLIPSRQAFAAWSKDESDYRSSTSGGASSVLSQFIIQQGGVVYGCAVLPGARIEHVRIDNKDNLHKIKGSKYVQSSIVGILPLLQKDIKENRLVLFIGTPCQVAAVKKLFNIIPDNLITVDLVCHGVPSQKSLHDYLKRCVSVDTIDDLSFRSEDGFIIKAFSNGQLLYSSAELWSNRYKDYYYNAFMDGFSYRDCCYECKYASPNRGSDVTIGDFWGLGNEMPCDGMPEHKFGVSLILINSDKGSSLFQAVSNSMVVFERPISEAINGNDQLRSPKEKTLKIRMFRVFQPIFGDEQAFKFVRRLARLTSIIKQVF